MPTGKAYVIFYGWLCDDVGGEPNAPARAIASLRLPMLIAHYRTAPPAEHVNLSPKVLALLHESGIEVFAYIRTDWGRADATVAQRQIRDYLAAGVDGIFLDEADSLCSDANYAYYEALASSVRNLGGQVIANAGVAQCGERIMQVCDRVMVEHAWRDARVRSLWLRRYPADRVMGVSSNEENAMGYAVDEQRAIADTHEAWTRGLGWHTSTDRYVELPEWFERYAEAVK